MMRFVFQILLSITGLMAYDKSNVQASVIDDFIALDLERELFLRSEGELNDRCGPFMPCVEGLDCTSTGGALSKVCLPRECAQEVFIDEFVGKTPDIEEYADMIIDQAGLRERSGSIFNQTTLGRGGRNVIDEDGAKYFLNIDARDAIVAAMLANPLDMSNFIARCDDCIPASSRVGPSVGGVTGFGGIVLEVEAGGSFYNSYYFAQGTNDTAGVLLTDVCLGIGPAAGASFGGLGGISFSGAANDMLGFSIMFDGDIAAAVGLGISAGTTVPGLVPQLEFTITAGVAAGIGGSLCFTAELTEF